MKKMKILSALSLTLLLLFSSCEKDLYDEAIQTEKNIKISKFSINDPAVFNNRNLMSEIQKVKEKQSIEQATGRIVYDSINNFYFDDENGIKVEDGDYDSYTFKVEREAPIDSKLENLVFSKNKEGGFDTFLIKYPYSEEQIKTLSSAEFENMQTELQILNKTLLIVCYIIKTYGNCTETHSNGVTCSSESVTYDCYSIDSGGGGSTGGSSFGDDFGSDTGGSFGSNDSNPILTSPIGGHVSGNNTNTPLTNAQLFFNSLNIVEESNFQILNTQAQLTLVNFLNNNPYNTFTNFNIKNFFNNLSFVNSDWFQNQSDQTQTNIINYLCQNNYNNNSNQFVNWAINEFQNGEDCVIIPSTINPSEITAPFNPNIFGDYPAPAVPQNHDAIQQQFNTLRTTSGNLAAVNYLISTYNMNAFGDEVINFNYSISFENGLSNGAHANAIRGFTNGIMTTCNLEIDINLFSSVDFGYITRVIKHELLHILQGIHYGQNGASVALQEFDAYYLQIFGFNNLKKIQTASIQYDLAKKMIMYMKQLTTAEQIVCEVQINKVKLYFPELCKD